jgi:hypothetical protein
LAKIAVISAPYAVDWGKTDAGPIAQVEKSALAEHVVLLATMPAISEGGARG